MSNKPKNASERQFQEDFTERMTHHRWQAPDFLNGNKQKVTVQTLVENWRQILNRINADQLESIPLTDGEFQQVMNRVNCIADSYDAAKLLAMENSVGKIDGIHREKQDGVTRNQVTLTIFKKANVGGGDSTYQIAREVWTDDGRFRFDMILLINGLPLINIEMKRADIKMEQAFKQLHDYYAAGAYVHNFLAFSQMMVITSEIETCYFATPRTKDSFNPSFLFHWADENNHPVNDWRKVIDKFLQIPMAHQMVGDYLVIYDAVKDQKNEEDSCTMVMRPYQVYALQAVELAALGHDQLDDIPHGGYIWHTTGSGKTITSFKTALFLSTRVGFDKVVFMVDRRELDNNTTQKFQAYASYEPVEVDATPYTYSLEKSLKHRGIVVTTTFKMDVLVKQKMEQKDFSLQEKRIVFIVDEAHRTTMGHMMGEITSFFRKNGLFFGFTGTPLFSENHVRGSINELSREIKTTKDLFGPELHRYTIDQAIADRNVLGFHVQYVNTGEFKSYDDLREQLIPWLMNLSENKKKKPDEIEELVWGWEDANVEEEASKAGILVYQDKTHIPVVVKRILDGWEAQSQGRMFNAILTVAYKSRVVEYYQEFQRQLEGQANPIHVAMTVSFGNPNDPERLEKSFVEKIFRDYAAFTDVEFVAGDPKNGEDAYFADLSARGQRGGSGRSSKNIDLIIVADQLLTGWDDRWLNTLYNDRILELQGLVQAYSRTNRVLGENKEFGTIINYKFPKLTEQAVVEALKLYGSGGSQSSAIVDTYAVAVQKFRQKCNEPREILPDPSEWLSLRNDERKCNAFLDVFRDAAKQLRVVEQYYEYAWNDDAFGMEEGTWLKYLGAYKNLKQKAPDEPEDEILQPLPGRVKVVGRTQVTASYIIGLVGEKSTVVDGVRAIDNESLRIILEKIEELESLGNKLQADILMEFVDDLKNRKVSAEGNADDAFTSWKKKKFDGDVHVFSEKWGVPEALLKNIINAYDPAVPMSVPRLDEVRTSLDYDAATEKHGDSRFEHLCDLEDALPSWLMETRKKYIE